MSTTHLPLFVHTFDREDSDAFWTEYVLSSSKELSEDWRHVPSESDSVLDWGESSDFLKDYPTATVL